MAKSRGSRGDKASPALSKPAKARDEPELPRPASKDEGGPLQREQRTPKEPPAVRPSHLLHAIYFRLTDASVNELFTAACIGYLSAHPGQLHFSIGPRAREINRDVSALGFDVAVTMIFATFSDYEAYRASKRHDEFITRTAGMSTGRDVFDAHVDIIEAKANA